MPEPLTLESLPPDVRSNPLVGTLVDRGWPLTKTAYLTLMFGPAEEPTFPLNGEVVSSVPRELDGPLPSNATAFWQARAALTSGSSRAQRPRRRSTHA